MNRRCWRGITWLLLVLPLPAFAGLLADRLEISMYGRLGTAWTQTGDYIHGRSFNVTGGPIGGRLEEGDYLEPTLRLRLIKPPQQEPGAPASTAPTLDMVLTPAMFAPNGLFLGVFSNRFTPTLAIELFQAYVEVENVPLPGLRLWAGARFNRGPDIHIADYFYFNNLSGQGFGGHYRGVDFSVLLQTNDTNPLYNIDMDEDGTLDRRRQRTVLSAQYQRPLGSDHLLHFLGELHVMPAIRSSLPESTTGLPSDWGWVAGVRYRMNLAREGFNDFSVRLGTRIASGSRGGAQTVDTFGSVDPDTGRFDSAAGVELVENFLYNFSAPYSLNAYGVLHLNRGAEGSGERAIDFAVGARGTAYVSEHVHLAHEATYQGVRDNGQPLVSAVKLSLLPTLVPSGLRSVWARPHLRLIYTVAFYNQHAQDTLASPYLRTVGARPVGHYLGSRVEWWF